MEESRTVEREMIYHPLQESMSAFKLLLCYVESCRCHQNLPQRLRCYCLELLAPKSSVLANG